MFLSIMSVMSITDWILLIVVAAIIGGAFWVVNDTRKRGANVGGKLCGGCPHYCQMNRNCDGTPKEPAAVSDKQA